MAGVIYMIIVISMFIGIHAGLYLIFKKAGIQAWKALVPVLNFWEILLLVGKPKWWIFWYFIPVVNLIFPFILAVEICKSFGRHSFKEHSLSIIAPYAYFIWLARKPDVEYLGTVPELKMNPKYMASFQYSRNRSWADAIVFALVAATTVRWFVVEAYTIPTPSMEDSMLVGDYLFVSKFHYGPRVPKTPLAIPLFHHTIPGINTDAYLDWVQLPYYRLPGLESIERNDILVFNFPVGDTVDVTSMKTQGESYYSRKRRGLINPTTPIDVRPLDKKENYVKRCVAVAGDLLEIKNDSVYIDGKLGFIPEESQLLYQIVSSQEISADNAKKFGVSFSDYETYKRNYLTPEGNRVYYFPLSTEMAKKMSGIPSLKSIEVASDIISSGRNGKEFYPHSDLFLDWDVSNYGPLWIPKGGETISLHAKNWALYQWVIERYEYNSEEEIKAIRADVAAGKNPEYTFKQDYFWLMGDNRHNSLDSRFWGFVPEDHVVGKPWFIWMSVDPDADGFISGIRWDRIFNFF